MAAEREGKARGPGEVREVLFPGRDIVEQKMHCSQEFFKLPGHGMEGMKSTAPKHYDLSASMQLSMLLLKEI